MVIEGFLWAAAPRWVVKLHRAAAQTPDPVLRTIGAGAAAAGVVAVLNGVPDLQASDFSFF
jgi:uncharacterized protein YjeT (DUF2065 family)